MKIKSVVGNAVNQTLRRSGDLAVLHISGLFALCFIFFGHPCFSQKFNWKSFTTTDGLVHNTARTIYQDHKGYIWIGTIGGVSRFDGEAFENYNLADTIASDQTFSVVEDDSGNLWFLTVTGVKKYDGKKLAGFTTQNGLADNVVTLLLKGRQGILWFGTKNGVSRFDGTKTQTYTEKDGLGGKDVSAISEDRKGNIWIGFRSGGLSRFNIANGDSHPWKSFNVKDGLPDAAVNDIREDNAGSLWVATHGGVVELKGEKFIPASFNTMLPSTIVLSVLFDVEGSLWVRTAGSGIFKWNKSRLTQYTTKDGLASDNVRSMLYDRNNQVWVATNNGVSLYEKNKFETFRMTDGLVSNFVNSISQDREGLLWFATARGVTLCEERRFSTFQLDDPTAVIPERGKTRSIFKDRRGNLWFPSFRGLGFYDGDRFRVFGPKDGLPDSVIYAIVQDFSEKTWVSTFKGLSVFEHNTLRIVEDPLVKGKSIMEMTVDKRGQLWIVRSDNVVGVYDGTSFSPFDMPGLSASHFTIIDVSADSSGNIWFHTIGGMIRYDGSSAKYITWAEIMPGGTFYTHITDKEGNMWVSMDKGLVRYNGKAFYRLTREEGLPLGEPLSINLDSGGALWLSMYKKDAQKGGSYTGIGVVRYDGKSFRQFTTTDGLLSDDAYMFFEEKKDVLWFRTLKGLSRFDGNSFKSFSVEDGLAGKVVNQIISDNAGNLWMGTNGGVSKYNGRFFSTISVKDGLLDPDVIDIQVDRNNRLWIRTIKGLQRYEEGTIAPNIDLVNLASRTKSYPLNGNLELPYNENSLTFQYRGISFVSSSEKRQYVYKLEGYDTTWFGPVRETKAAFHNLSPGAYRFSVKAIANDLLESERAAEFAFEILPPFWKTLWFRALSLGVVLGGLYSVYLWRTKALKERSIRLEQMVKERTKELEAEKNKSDELLHNILPAEVIKELKEKGISQPREYKTISILFTDFMGFTNISSTLPAEKLVGELNDIFKDFDAIIEKYRLEKLKTIGDAYMIACGLPIESDDHAVRIVKAAIEMQEYVSERNKHSAFKWQMRAGVHSGHVVAGIVGKKKFTYDVWGDTVNIASRMESACEAGRVNISAFTFDLLKEHFECEYRGKIEAKGKGMIDMYNVVGRKAGS